MKLNIANKDRTADLGKAIEASAATRRAQPGPRFLYPAHSALALKQARSNREYLDIFTDLMQIRSGLNTAGFPIPRKAGLAGKAIAVVRKFLWKVLRYQHDRMAFQQGAILHMLISSLRFEKAEREKETSELRDRIRALESRLRDSDTPPPREAR